MDFNRFFVTSVVLLCGMPAFGQRGASIKALEPEIRPVSFEVPLGQPVWVRFTLRNTADEAITVTVPGTEPAIPSPESGLPIEHVFSGGADFGLSVTASSGRRWDEPSGYHVPTRAPLLIIAPRSSVGRTLDLREYFPALRGAGQYRVSWRPYAGATGERTVVVSIGQLKRAEIVTDEGAMTVRFFYGDAPQHVTNFIELVEAGFYNGKLFHRIEQGYLLQGGCPRGDGTGIRPDGKRLRAEFNGHPMRKGTVAMALLEDDPDSGSCQFFICNTRHKDWDGRYTIFGELVGDDSYATLERLMRSGVDESGRPLRPLQMRTVRIVNAPSSDVR